MRPIIEVEDLVKVYPNGTSALAGVSFDVEEGGFFGLLGPNGAGKTTTFKILMTLLKKTSGRVKVAGFDINEDDDSIRCLFGCVAQEAWVDRSSSVRQNLIDQALLRGFGGSKARRRAEELLEMLSLAELAKRFPTTLSGGEIRRLDLALAILHSPSLLFLDEPTAGLDVGSRLALWQYLADLNRTGVTIFLATHNMDEADRLCDRLAIINNGRIVAADTPENLKKGIGGDVVSIILARESLDTEVRRAEELVRAMSDDGQMIVSGRNLFLPLRDAGSKLSQIALLLTQDGIRTERLDSHSATLEDVFLLLTHEPMSEGPEGSQRIHLDASPPR